MENLYKVGEYNGEYNRILDIDLPCAPIYVSCGLRKHIQSRHSNCLDYIDKIPEIINNPDYIGKNPTEPNSIELVKGEYHDYHVYLNATRYTVEPGHRLAVVIATEDPVNCLIHKTYSIEIDNASVRADVPVTAFI